MLQIVAASSLFHSIETLDPAEQEDLKYTVEAEPGYSLIQHCIDPKKNALNFINQPRNLGKQIILWHDLINNSLTPHHSNKHRPLSVNELIRVLKTLKNLFAVIYCQRTGAPNIFNQLRELDIFVIDIPSHILSKTEQLDTSIKAQYKKLHQSPDAELRSLAVVLHYHPQLNLIYRQRSSKPRPSKSRRRAKRNRLNQQ